MTFDQLEYYIAIAEYKNMTKAARELNIVQPALSRSIKRLEEEFETTFFDRKGKQLELTSEGEIFYQFAKQCINHYQTMAYALKNKPLHGKLIIGHMLENPIIFDSIIDFTKQYNQVNTEVYSLPKTVKFSKYHFLFAPQYYESYLEEGSYHCMPLYHEPLIVLASKKHPLAGHDTVTIHDLKSYPILLPKETEFTRFIDKLFTISGYKPSSRFHTNDMTMHARLIANSDYLSITPAYSIIHGDADSYVKLPFENENSQYQRTVSLYWHTNHELNSIETAFIEVVKKHFQK